MASTRAHIYSDTGAYVKCYPKQRKMLVKLEKEEFSDARGISSIELRIKKSSEKSGQKSEKSGRKSKKSDYEIVTYVREPKSGKFNTPGYRKKCLNSLCTATLDTGSSV